MTILFGGALYNLPTGNTDDQFTKYLLFLVFGAWAGGICLGLILAELRPWFKDKNDFPFNDYEKSKASIIFRDPTNGGPTTKP